MDAIQNFFEAVPFDFMVLGSVAIVIALDTLRSGVGRAASLAVALMLGMVLAPFLNTAVLIGPLVATSPYDAIAFGASVVLGYMLARRIGLEYLGSGGNALQAALAGVAVSALVAIVWLSMPSLSAVWKFGPFVTAVFADAYRLYWVLAAFTLLAFARA